MCCGIPVELIKAQGDWKSNAYEHYLDETFCDWLKALSIVVQNVKKLIGVVIYFTTQFGEFGGHLLGLIKPKDLPPSLCGDFK